MAGTNGSQTTIPANAVTSKGMQKVIVGLLPFTPVPFSGKDMPLAVGRILLYGGVAYLLWGKEKEALNRKISYAAIVAAGLSIATSISASAYQV